MPPNPELPHGSKKQGADWVKKKAATTTRGITGSGIVEATNLKRLLKEANERLVAEPLSANAPEPPDENILVSAISQRYEKLNDLWRTAEDQIKRFMVAAEVRHIYRSELDDDYDAKQYDLKVHHCIAWAKAKGTYRLCYGYFEEEWEINNPDRGYEYTPVLDASLELRKALAPHFAALKQKVIEAAQKAVPELDDVITQLANSLQ